jgi:sulfur-oxidizing protein SoxX
MSIKVHLGAAVLLLLALTGCDREVTMSEKGFRLPDGDEVAGRQAFLDLQCHQCHTLRGTEFPQIHGLDPPYVELGGPVSRVKTYGQLVTAIINPSHDLATGYAEEVVSEDGESNMYNYNGYMTVQQLTDIVHFLQPYYEVVTPDVTFPVYP